MLSSFLRKRQSSNRDIQHERDFVQQPLIPLQEMYRNRVSKREGALPTEVLKRNRSH